MKKVKEPLWGISKVIVHRLKKVECPRCLGTGVVQDMVRLGRDMRDSRQISLRDAAKCMGITASHLCYLEQGKRRWNPELVRKYKECCR